MLRPLRGACGVLYPPLGPRRGGASRPPGSVVRLLQEAAQEDADNQRCSLRLMTKRSAVTWYDRHAATVAGDYAAHEPATLHAWAFDLLPPPSIASF